MTTTTETIAVEDSKPWSDREAWHYKNTAQSCFRHSYQHSTPDPDNCCACALRVETDPDGPNVAGWARLFVEAGYSMPELWRDAFNRELNSSNIMYAAALKRSLLTFGMPRFHS